MKHALTILADLCLEMLWYIPAVLLIAYCFGCNKNAKLHETPTPWTEAEPVYTYLQMPTDPCKGFALQGQFCFGDEWWKATNGPCRPGTWECNSWRDGLNWSGEIVCAGQVLPQPEQCSDVDEDCNGALNNDLTITPRGVILFIDTSGSMCDWYGHVTYVMEQLTVAASAFDYRFAVVDISARTEEYTSEVYIIQDFAGKDETLATIAALDCEGHHIERAYDAIVKIGTGEILLSWPDSDTLIGILFTDERAGAQSEFGYTETFIGDRLEWPLFVWSRFEHDWDYIVDQTGGAHYPLVDDRDVMTQQALDVVEALCL